MNEAIVKELRLDTEVPEAFGHVRFLGGDQLSIARLRALEFIRAGQEEEHEGYFWGAWIPGLFHAKIADAHGTLVKHLIPALEIQARWLFKIHIWIDCQ